LFTFLGAKTVTPSLSLQQASKLLCNFVHRLLVELLISFPKVLVAAANGNALGFGTALLGLCDMVYATDKVSARAGCTVTLQVKLLQSFLDKSGKRKA